MLRTHPVAHLLGLPKRKPAPKASKPKPAVSRRAAKPKRQADAFDHLRIGAEARAAGQPPTPKPAASPKPGSAAARAVAAYRKALGSRAQATR